MEPDDESWVALSRSPTYKHLCRSGGNAVEPDDFVGLRCRGFQPNLQVSFRRSGGTQWNPTMNSWVALSRIPTYKHLCRSVEREPTMKVGLNRGINLQDLCRSGGTQWNPTMKVGLRCHKSPTYKHLCRSGGTQWNPTMKVGLRCRKSPTYKHLCRSGGTQWNPTMNCGSLTSQPTRILCRSGGTQWNLRTM